MNKKNFLLLSIISAAFFLLGLFANTAITKDDIAAAERLFGLSFTDAKRDSMLGDVQSQLENFEKLREVHLPNSAAPSMIFDPLPAGFTLPKGKKIFSPEGIRNVTLPRNLDDLAFYSVSELSVLIKSRKIASEQLTKLYIERIKKYGPKLECIITLTESLALAQARNADKEISAGKYRGPLHGIPYGAKDLLATKGIRTTWGSVPFKEQVIDVDATVITKLREAGAVLVAKTTLGELAWGDVWFGGKTRNPWDTSQGSSGSSAGSAAGTAAGLFAFAIGSETYGSIVSPSTVCGTTGLRPSYGMVSRTGAMALSWSMDKLGPICRSVEDCALVFNAIYGTDGIDPTVYNVPFRYAPKSVDLKKLRIGYLKSDFDSLKWNKELNDSALATLRSLGVELIPVELPKLPVNDISIILSAESAAAFDELTRSGKDDLLVRQIKRAWPNSFRASRFIPAVEYIHASRVRRLLIDEMHRTLNTLDVYIAPSLSGNNLLLTNLTGHPCVVVPIGFTSQGTPTSITFMGKLFEEGTVLAVAKKFQDATQHHLKHPILEQD